MKKLFTFLWVLGVLALLSTGASAAGKVKTYLLYLGATDSGNTTVVSGGVSNLIIEGDGHNRSTGSLVISNIDERLEGFWTVQLDEITESQVQQDAGGSLDSMSFTLRYRVSNIDNANAWSGVSTYDVPELNAITLSGTTRYQVGVEVPEAQFIRWDFLTSGATPFDHVKFKVRAR